MRYRYVSEDNLENNTDVRREVVVVDNNENDGIGTVGTWVRLFLLLAAVVGVRVCG